MSTNETSKTDLCLEVAEHLTDVLEGTASARLFDHVADCDACRDLRHEAGLAAERVGVAGRDFRAPTDFAERLIARIEEARPASAALPASPAAAEERTPRVSGEVVGTVPVAQPADAALAAPALGSSEVGQTAPPATEPAGIIDPPRATASSGSHKVAPTMASDPDADDADGANDPAGEEAEPLAHRARRPRREAVAADTGPADLGRSTGGVGRAARHRALPSGAPVVSPLRRPMFYVGLVAAVSAAAAIGFALKGKAEAPATAEVDGAWSGKVTAIARASADKTGGLEACDAAGACAPLAVDGEIRPGAKLRTDTRTRAHLTLGDGTELALDRGTTVEIVAAKTRVAKLVEGAIVADVAHLDAGAPAHVTFPHGDVEVLGTKLAVTATADRATVEVARGEVRVLSDAGKAVNVRAGEEATIAGGREPEVASATSLADELEWSDKTPEELDAPVLRGLGELRARKPGATAEKDHAVRLAKHAVKVRVVDVVARTEVDETFTNDTDEELEGIFRFPLPPGAQIEKLSLEVDGKLVDGAFVDRDRGAAIWRGVIQNAAPKTPRPREEIIWVAGPWRDPALLEWQRGGRFELKIFPIPRRGSRRVVLTYTQVVDQSAGVRRFTYPLALDTSGTTTVDAFDLDLQVLGGDKSFGVQTRGYELKPATAEGAGERRVMHADRFIPAGDLTVEYALPDRAREVTAWAYQASAPVAAGAAATPGPGAAVKAKTANEKAASDAASAIEQDGSPFVAIAVRPKLPRWQDGKERLHVLVVDASRSMVGERFSRATHLASSIVREMDRRDAFLVLACDTVCRPMGGARGSSAGAAPGAAAAADVERFLGTIEPDGGSDLAGAISAARAAAGPLGGRELRVIYLGDGTPTVGPTRPSHLEAAVRGALPDRDGSVIAVALGADADTTSLAALARGGGGLMVPYVPGQKVSTAAIDVLGAAYGLALREPDIELPAGLTQVTPAHLDPIRAGGEAFVVARMTGGQVSGSLKLRGRVGAEKFEQSYPLTIVASSNSGNAFVPRLYAAAKISELEALGGESEKPMVIELSRRFSVASRYTSLLVLESEAMYSAFGVDRTAAKSVFTGEDAADSSSTDGDVKLDESGADDLSTAPGHARSKSPPADLGSLGGGSAAGLSAGAPAAKESSRASAAMGPAEDRKGDFGDAPQAQATAAPPPPASRPAPVAANPYSGADKEERESPAKAAKPKRIARDDFDRPPPRQPWGGGRRMIPMRKVFDRKASFDMGNTLAQQNAPKLIVAESAIQGAPNSRDRTVELFALYATSGRIGEAQELTARWSGRDALDPDALLARADLAARRGDRERAIRILGGLADVRPGDRAPQVRLAELEEAAGNRALACEHRITLADMAPGEAKLVADAVRCARNQGQVDLASLLARDAGDKVRDQVERLVATPPPARALRGDIQLTADWSGAEDLDVALIDAQGRRISWLGSANKVVSVTSTDVTSTRTEALSLSNLPSGNYVVEITRANGGENANGGTVRGDVTLRLVGETRKIPFALTGARAEIGTVRVFFTSHLVPIEGGGPGWGGPIF